MMELHSLGRLQLSLQILGGMQATESGKRSSLLLYWIHCRRRKFYDKDAWYVYNNGKKCLLFENGLAYKKYALLSES